MSDLLIQIEHYLDPNPEAPTAWARFILRMKSLYDEVQAGYWATVAIDSVTNASLVARKRSQYKTTRGTDTASWYQDATDELEEQFCQRLASMPCNVVLTAHVQEKTDKKGNVVKVTPSLPGRLRSGLPANFETYRSYTRVVGGKAQTWLQTEPSTLYPASSSVIISPPNPCEPTYDAIWANYRDIENVDRPYQDVLIYGEGGTKKSQCVATFTKPLLVLMFDSYGKVGPYLAAGVPGPLDTSGPTPIRGVFAS